MPGSVARAGRFHTACELSTRVTDRRACTRLRPALHGFVDNFRRRGSPRAGKRILFPGADMARRTQGTPATASPRWRVAWAASPWGRGTRPQQNLRRKNTKTRPLRRYGTCCGETLGGGGNGDRVGERCAEPGVGATRGRAWPWTVGTASFVSRPAHTDGAPVLPVPSSPAASGVNTSMGAAMVRGPAGGGAVAAEAEVSRSHGGHPGHVRKTAHLP